MGKIFKQNYNVKNESIYDEMRETLMNDFNYNEPSKLMLFAMSPFYKVLFWIGHVCLTVLFLVAAFTVSAWMLLIYIPIIIATIVLYYKGSKLRKQLNNQIYSYHLAKVDYIHQKYFADMYDDIEITGFADKNNLSWCVEKHTSRRNPKYANLSSINPYYSFKGNNGAVIDMAIVTFTVPSNSLNKPAMKLIKYKTLVLSNLKPTLADDYEFHLLSNLNMSFPKQDTSFENEKFNSKWYCFRSEEVKSRMILTPSVQEEVLKGIKNNTFEMKKVYDFFSCLSSIEPTETVLRAAKKDEYAYGSKTKIVNYILEATMKDVFEMDSLLRNACVFRTLFKTI